MKHYKFEQVLFNDGWRSNVCISVDESGRITALGKEQPNISYESFHHYLIPGFQNAHSHSFQYAMAGLAEIHPKSSQADDFWSWRNAMYALALQISPEDIYSIAKMLYMEMLVHGYTNVAEFHYVHHDKNGNPFGNLSEMGERLIRAAKDVGINITLVPIYYEKGGFGKPPVDGQKRFISPSIDDYLKLYSASKTSCENYIGANVAIGIHSMRGVDPENIKNVACDFDKNVPFHIHISEQLREIEDSINYLGKRPVEWFAENIQMDDRFHLVHATHLTREETLSIANSGANVVLCPSTEGNLGDGLFPVKTYLENYGNWSIGTDSHIGLNPYEELRILDYGQRLTTHKRDTFVSQGNNDSGFFAFDAAMKAGRKAMNNFEMEYFKVGEELNAVIVDSKHPLVASSSMEKVCSTLIYSGDVRFNKGTFVRGEMVIDDGVHRDQESIGDSFVSTLKKLAVR